MQYKVGEKTRAQLLAYRNMENQAREMQRQVLSAYVEALGIEKRVMVSDDFSTLTVEEDNGGKVRDNIQEMEQSPDHH